MGDRGLVVDLENGTVVAGLRELDSLQNPNEGDVLLRVLFSSLNYKDALAVTGRGKIIRGAFPFVPGIDLVAEVTASDAPSYREGDLVIGTGWGLGEDHWGGYAQVLRVRSAWLVPLPEGLSPRDAMGIGTAGFTAMLSVMALEEHGVSPTKGEVVVTGATGGVGSLSVALLAQRGFHVVASTGKAEAGPYLQSLGAARIIPREDLGQGARRPLEATRWAGGIDSVGGATLEALLSQTGRHGAVAACGLAGAASLNTTVFPFILRGVNLLGIDSNTCPQDRRREAWANLAKELSPALLDSIVQVVPLQAVPSWSEQLLGGKVTGRIVVDVQA